jgi:hypothetical protein
VALLSPARVRLSTEDSRVFGRPTRLLSLLVVALLLMGIALADPTPLAWGSTLTTPHQKLGSAAGKPHQAPSAVTAAKTGRKAATPAGAAPPAGPHSPTGAPQRSNTGQSQSVQGNAAARTRTTTPRAGAEVMGKRTATTSVFANDDGSFTSRVYSRPVHYQTSNGSWADINTDLARGTDGSWREKANALAPSFADTGDSSSLVTRFPWLAGRRSASACRARPACTPPCPAAP